MFSDFGWRFYKGKIIFKFLFLFFIFIFVHKKIEPQMMYIKWQKFLLKYIEQEKTATRIVIMEVGSGKNVPAISKKIKNKIKNKK